MERNEIQEGTMAVAIDREKSSHQALKWAVEHYIPRSRSVKLVHVIQRSPLTTNGPSLDDELPDRKNNGRRSSQMFLALRCLCMRRNIQSEIVLLEDQDVAKALIEYITQNSIGTFLLGATVKKSITRLFKGEDIPSNVMRWAPDYCTVLVVSKGKLASVRSATRPLPQALMSSSTGNTPLSPRSTAIDEAPSVMSLSRDEDVLFEELSTFEPDTPAVARISTDNSLLSFYENLGSRNLSEISKVSSMDWKLCEKSKLSVDLSSSRGLPCISEWAPETNTSVGNTEDNKVEMSWVRIELKQTMEMYRAACREALAAKQKVAELEIWKKSAEQRLQMAEETTLAIVEIERLKCKAALEKAETAQRLVELEVKRRVDAERVAMREAEQRKMALDALGQSRAVVKHESLLHILIVLFLLYLYFSMFK
ncbi:PREDICTED: U-box domain-containing protein 51-like [Tarenaya hassleriana]|uniref:U-box domain-containing protein 51-like n=1 Tax=Tarenaya hassleriana TaxID=28532 RepID=UPI00053C3358|nr:PREDICTED: U-box domain-containing protein 51-like [Tarenaya hassleriana]XP_010520564.1 PREDICTED: U-box domain-containing protein 51-like [Tarenaya hassleriana]XP_010520565.1 PREDICTED: U-box domain-containing protein 51-like [Tarenaya hassleriana]